MLQLLHPAQQPFDLAQIVSILTPPPTTNAPAADNQLAHRIPQQGDVRGVMHIRFDHKGVTPTL